MFPPLFTHSQRQPAPRPHGGNSAWNAAQNSSIHTPDTVAAGTTPPAPRLRCEAYGLSSRFGIAPLETASAIKRPNQHQFPKEKHGLLGIIDCFRTVRPKEDKQSMPSFRCGVYELIFSVRNRLFGNCIGNRMSEPAPIP